MTNIDNAISVKLSKLKKYRILDIISNLGSFYFVFMILIVLILTGSIALNRMSIISAMSLLINTAIVFILKFTVKRNRIKNKNRIDIYSFPSGHVSRLAGFIFPTMSIIILPVMFFISAVLVGLARIMKGYHYFSDCLAGFVIGIISGLVANLFAFCYVDKISSFIHYCGAMLS